MARKSADEVANALSDRVLSGEFAPDSQLPSERQLALEYGVSRPMVREALRSLVERGLIDIEPSRGAFVHGDTGARRFPPLDTEYRRRGTTARQLSEVRRMLEMEAVVLATEYADESDLARIEAALDVLEASATPLERVRNDLMFHISLVAAAHNPVLETMFASIQTLTVELMVRSSADDEIIRRGAPDHRIAFEAIRARDAETAREAIRSHLSVAATTYGDDYDRSLESTASASLRLIGAAGGLEDFLREVALHASDS